MTGGAEALAQRPANQARFWRGADSISVFCGTLMPRAADGQHQAMQGDSVSPTMPPFDTAGGSIKPGAKQA
jgi:hypothetical protein